MTEQLTELEKMLCKMTIEISLLQVAEMAEKYADTVPKGVDAQTALIAFARAIRSTNKKVWGAPEA